MIDKLEMLLALARERHFGKAAQALNIGQPTLSAGLKSLEEHLGTMLVERGSRFRCFTPEGERVLDWARRIVGDVRSMRQEVDGLKRGLAGHLRLAVIPTALPFVTELTVPFRQRYPDVHFTVLSQSSEEVMRHLDNLETDIGMTYTDTEPLGRVESVKLYEERYVLLISPEHALSNRRSMTWAEVARLPLCLLTKDVQSRRMIDRQLLESGTDEEPTLQSNSMLILYAHVRSGDWVSILPSRLAETLERPGRLRAIALTAPTVTHTIGLVTRRREPNSPLITAFIAHAKRVANPTSAVTA